MCFISTSGQGQLNGNSVCVFCLLVLAEMWLVFPVYVLLCECLIGVIVSSGPGSVLTSPGVTAVSCAVRVCVSVFASVCVGLCSRTGLTQVTATETR